MNKIFFWGWYSDYDCHTINSLKKFYNIKNISLSKLSRLIFKFSRLVLPVGLADLFINGFLLVKTDKTATLIFSDDILYYMRFALGLKNKRKIIVFRNIISRKCMNDIQRLKEAGFELYTFDPSDAEFFNIDYKGQYLPVYNIQDMGTSTNSAYFLGLNKGRKKILVSLAEKLNEKGIVANFTIIDESKKNLFKANKKIAYIDNIRNVIQSRYIIDIVRVGQNGMTLRALESAFYKRKLITNNPNIIKTDLYHPNNVLVIDEQLNIPDDFLAKPFHEYSESVLHKYNSDNYYIEILKGKQSDKNT
ncbi:hypothetical protein ACX4ED_001124 [Cronobacter malonaticus]